jgi:hypothetical protein
VGVGKASRAALDAVDGPLKAAEAVRSRSDLDDEVVPNSGDRKHLERAGRNDSGIAHEDVQTRLAQSLGEAAATSTTPGRAACTASWPAVPPAPRISTVSPGRRWPWWPGWLPSRPSLARLRIGELVKGRRAALLVVLYIGPAFLAWSGLCPGHAGCRPGPRRVTPGRRGRPGPRPAPHRVLGTACPAEPAARCGSGRRR